MIKYILVTAVFFSFGISGFGLQAFAPSKKVSLSKTSLNTAVKPKKQVIHEMQQGETLWGIAVDYQVSVSQILQANHLTSNDVHSISVGTQLKIPGGVISGANGNTASTKKGAKKPKAVKRATSSRASKKNRGAKRRAEKLGLGTRQAAGMLLRGQVKPSWIKAAGGRRDRFPGTLRWPVTNGWFVRGFGSGKQGYHLAVDIAGKIGWNVRASAPGIVGYSGNGIRGYGNIVIVIHPGGWVTLYAHNSVNFVVAGQRVKKGTVLGELGNTGISRGPHVHFALIYDKKNCDPALLFRPGIKHRNKKISPYKYTSWKNPSKRPGGVQCLPPRKYPKGNPGEPKDATVAKSLSAGSEKAPAKELSGTPQKTAEPSPETL